MQVMTTPINEKIANEIRGKISHEYRSKYGLKIILHESSNPSGTGRYTATVYKSIHPHPLDAIDEEIAEGAIEQLSKKWNSPSINVRCWDMSRPHDSPYSRKAYVWATAVESKEDIDKVRGFIKEAEEWYKAKREKVRKEIESSPTLKDTLLR